MNREIMSFIKDEDGVGVVEVILILVVLIGIVAVFRNEITSIITNAVKSFKSDAGTVTSPYAAKK